MTTKNLLFLTTVASLSLATFPHTTTAAPPAAGTWSAEPTFVDEFNGDSLDKSKWSTGYRFPDVINNEMQGFVPENVTVEDGVCKIKVEKRTVQNTDWAGYKGAKKEYASGAIQTYNKWAQAYGYFEVKAKMPGGKGTWPAFWMLPDRGAAVKDIVERTATMGAYKGVPIARGIEIDIFEIMGSWTDPKTGAGKSHSGYFWGYDGKSAWGGYALANNGAGPEHYVVPNQNTEFHTYGVAWGPGQLDWYIDGDKVLSREEPPSMTKIGSAPHYMILNIALKNDDWTPRRIPIAEIDADLPRTMVIDYVKAWSGTPTPSPAPVAEGTYRITPLSDATKCLQVDGAGMEDGGKVNQATYTGAANQQWELSYLGASVYEIKAKHSGKLLNVIGGNGSDFTKIEQAADTDAIGQRWKLQAVGTSGFYRVIPMVNAKSALSTYGKAERAGAYIFYSSGDPGQRWKFEPVDAPPAAGATPPTGTAAPPAGSAATPPTTPAATPPAGTTDAPTVAAATLPAVPLGLAMVANSPDSITLAWYRSPNNDATGYNVYTSATKDGTYTRLATVTERTATHKNLTADTTYFYKVSATNAHGESAQSAPVNGFTIKPAAATLFPVKIAKNMCVSLGATIVSDSAPITGKLADLVDGSDATTCRLRKACELKIQLKDTPSIADAEYLMVHFRTHGTSAEWSNDPFARTLRNYVVIESHDSTTGKDGTWQEVASGTNDLLDGVIVLPNHKPKWIGIRSSGGPAIPKDDKRPNPGDLMLCRLDIFRSAPAGYRNDYWIFTGDSLVVQDLPGGAVAGRSAWFSDLVRQQHPDRYPMVVHAARGGEMLKDTLPRMKKILPILSPPNGTTTPTATIVCWESGFNDIGLSAGLWIGEKIIKSLTEAQELCTANGVFLVPARIEHSTAYLDMNTLEPKKYNIFHNTLAANLAGVDVFARSNTPYAVDPKTQLPYADYWTYTRNNYATALAKDGVHHTKEGSDGINRLWAEVADKMIYSKQP
ncbi:MAG: RICIN domain-containing protein [Armatimonadota bacterium]|nr:RICIN domain-containing protein [Armatimonadota bacterium]